MLSRLLVLVIIASAGCAGSPPYVGLGLPSPNPNGCYIIVYEQPDFRAVGTVVNGPGKWSDLDALRPDRGTWRNRIRSLRIGNAATLIMFTGESFTGRSERFEPDSQHARLNQAVSGRVQSLDLTCR